MNALDGDLFSELFGAWLEGLREDEPDIVAIDGNTSRRARGGDNHPLHVVSAWAARQRLVLGLRPTRHRLFRVRDGTFAEDACRVRTRSAPQNRAHIRDAALTLI